MSSDSSASPSLLLSSERLLATFTIALVVVAGAYKISKFVLCASPFVEVLCTLFVFALLGSLVGSGFIHFSFSVPATAIKFLNLQDASWDDSIIVRWAVMLQTSHETQSNNPDGGSAGVTVIEIQAALLLMVLGFVGMRLLHHAVVISRLLKVARRNQHLILKNPNQDKK